MWAKADLISTVVQMRAIPRVREGPHPRIHVPSLWERVKITVVPPLLDACPPLLPEISFFGFGSMKIPHVHILYIFTIMFLHFLFVHDLLI